MNPCTARVPLYSIPFMYIAFFSKHARSFFSSGPWSSETKILVFSCRFFLTLDLLVFPWRVVLEIEPYTFPTYYLYILLKDYLILGYHPFLYCGHMYENLTLKSGHLLWNYIGFSNVYILCKSDSCWIQFHCALCCIKEEGELAMFLLDFDNLDVVKFV